MWLIRCKHYQIRHIRDIHYHSFFTRVTTIHLCRACHIFDRWRWGIKHKTWDCSAGINECCWFLEKAFRPQCYLGAHGWPSRTAMLHDMIGWPSWTAILAGGIWVLHGMVILVRGQPSRTAIPKNYSLTIFFWDTLPLKSHLILVSCLQQYIVYIFKCSCIEYDCCIEKFKSWSRSTMLILVNLQ